MEKVTVMPLETFQSTAFPDSSFLLVTASGSQIAVLTQDRHLFCGSIGRVTSMVHIAKDESIDLKNTGMLFEERGWLTLLSPAISNFTQLYDFNKCKLNLQLAGWRSQQSCIAEILTGAFQNKLYYNDMHESLTLKAIFVPKPGKRSAPLVTVRNPQPAVSAGFQCVCNRSGIYTWWKHRIPLAYSSGAAVFLWICRRWLLRWRVVYCHVAIPDNPIGCVDVAPLTALVAVFHKAHQNF